MSIRLEAIAIRLEAIPSRLANLIANLSKCFVNVLGLLRLLVCQETCQEDAASGHLMLEVFCAIFKVAKQIHCRFAAHLLFNINLPTARLRIFCRLVPCLGNFKTIFC